MKKATMFITLVIAFLVSSAQNPDTTQDQVFVSTRRVFPNNSIYIEWLGHSMGIGSLNYERVFFHQRCFYISGRAGIGIHPARYQTTSVPLLVNGICQLSNAFAFELGVGTCLTYTSWDDWTEYFRFLWFSSTTFHQGGTYFDALFTGNIGIRLQSKNGFLFRFMFTPNINLKEISEELVLYSIIPEKIGYWFGLTIGFSFPTKR